MSKYKITLEANPISEVKTYKGSVIIDGFSYMFYITDNDIGSSDHDVDFMDSTIESELLEHEITELKIAIRNKYQNEF